jgi:hypothetical protein
MDDKKKVAHTLSQLEHDLVQKDSEVKLTINVTLLGICFTLFVIITALKAPLLENPFLSLQLTLAIPFFLTASFSRSKFVEKHQRIKRWELFSYITFILGYSLLLNSTGILLATIAAKWLAIPFFVLNIILAILYSVMEVFDDHSKLKKRLFRDGLFAVIILLFGLLPALGIYGF